MNSSPNTSTAYGTLTTRTRPCLSKDASATMRCGLPSHPPPGSDQTTFDSTDEPLILTGQALVAELVWVILSVDLPAKSSQYGTLDSYSLGNTTPLCANNRKCPSYLSITRQGF